MKEAPEQEKFKELLLHERSRLLGFREGLSESFRVLQQPDRELEERAQKENFSRAIEQLDTLETERIEAIDRALRNLETGSYGFCERCGDRIDEERLEALPWASRCLSCAGSIEEEEKPLSVKTRGRDLDPDYEGMSCEEREAVIREGLREDGRIDTQELELECDGEKVFLKGFLPSEEEHQTLLHLLEDTLGLRNIVDELAVKRQLWERQDRTTDRTEDEEAEDNQTLLEGEREKEETYRSMQDGTTTLAPDELIPEKPE